MLKHSAKKKLIGMHCMHDKDTGSPHVQIAILTSEIDLLVKHLQEHPKDESARRGLLGKVAQRRKILNWLRMHDLKAYEKVLEANKLKK
jgi:small subunit ribosomal protein S15